MTERPALPTDEFASRFRSDSWSDGPSSPGRPPDWVQSGSFGFFMSSVAGSSYDAGLIRFLHETGDPNNATANGPDGWLADWPGIGDRLWVFAYDWLGRLYGFDRNQSGVLGSTISRLDPADGAILTADVAFDAFVVDLLIDGRNDTLAADFFHEWLGHGGRPLRPNECVGYTIPLFLGGHEELANLEIATMDVHLSLAGQLWAQTRSIPLGTRIGQVNIE